jgi:hypothetical protein
MGGIFSNIPPKPGSAYHPFDWGDPWACHLEYIESDFPKNIDDDVYDFIYYLQGRFPLPRPLVSDPSLQAKVEAELPCPDDDTVGYRKDEFEALKFFVKAYRLYSLTLGGEDRARKSVCELIVEHSMIYLKVLAAGEPQAVPIWRGC